MEWANVEKFPNLRTRIVRVHIRLFCCKIDHSRATDDKIITFELCFMRCGNFFWEGAGMWFGNGKGMGMKFNNPGNGNGNGNCSMGMGGNGNQKPIPEHLYPAAVPRFHRQQGWQIVVVVVAKFLSVHFSTTISAQWWLSGGPRRWTSGVYCPTRDLAYM